MKGSGSKTQSERAIRILNAISPVSQNELDYIQLESKKDGEIQAFQELIRKLNLKRAVISEDALP